MKIWNEHAADHSAKLKIVGTFKTVEDAKDVVNKVNGLISLLEKDLHKEEGQAYAKEVLEYTMNNNFMLTPEAVNSSDLHYPIENIDNKIVVETDDIEIQLFIESFINNGGKIEIMSKHDNWE